MDWEQIKIEYISGEASYRKLAAKYNISATTLSERAKREEWVRQRAQHRAKSTAKILDAIGAEQAKRAARLQAVADKLLKKVEESVEKFEMDELFADKQALKQITGAIKDIKDIQMIRSAEDLEEQKARIANLRRQAEAASEDRSVRVVLDQMPEEWTK